MRTATRDPLHPPGVDASDSNRADGEVAEPSGAAAPEVRTTEPQTPGAAPKAQADATGPAASRTTHGPAKRPTGPRTGLAMRARSRALRVGSAAASSLPDRVAVGLADLAGEAWYRAASGRAEQGRLNLQRVCSWLVANDLATDRVRAAATDPVALERLLRAAFRHAARYYMEVARTSTLRGDGLDRLHVETAQALDAAIAGGAVIFVGLHFGAMELPAAYIAHRAGIGVAIPMETIADPGLQAWFEVSRGKTGIRTVDLKSARRELVAALRRGEPVALVGDRDLTGGGMETVFFGAPASLPIGPALLAMETGAPVYLIAVRRAGGGHYVGRVEPIHMPGPEGGSRRERATAYLQREASVFERTIARAPEQWWALFFPIWSDLVARPPASPRPGLASRAGISRPANPAADG